MSIGESKAEKVRKKRRKVGHLAHLVLLTLYNSGIYSSILHACNKFCIKYSCSLLFQTIDEQGLMSPLMVIRTLAGSPLSNLGNVRPYLLSVCQSEQKQVDEHARVIEQYRVETNQVRQRIHDLQSQALTLKQTKCSGKCHFQKKVIYSEKATKH